MLTDHPILSTWMADPGTHAMLGFEAELDDMLRFEIELAAAQADLGFVTRDVADRIGRRMTGFEPDRDALRAATTRDGVIVPGLIGQMRDALRGEGDGPGERAAEALHLGTTSQDVIDTALMLRLQRLAAAFIERLGAVERHLLDLSRDWGDRPLMAVTRMRDALPITVADRIAVWSAGVANARAELVRLRDTGFALQLAGPVGTLATFGERGPALRSALADRLGLSDPGGSWHAERSRLVRIAAALSMVTTALGKIGADIGLMAQDGTGMVVLEGGGSSSMAHKVNPVDAELLMALSAHAGALLGTVGQAALHASERAGPAWTLEWLTLPQLAHCAGGALRATERLLPAIRAMG